MNQAVLVILIFTVIMSIKGFNDRIFFERFKFQVQAVLAGDKKRLLSSGFLHADFSHLAFNMYALYLFGGITADSLGSLSFVVIYLGSLLAGGLYALYYHKDNPYYSAIGASGAVSGVLIASILLYPSNTYTFIFFPFIDIPGYVLGVGYIVYSIYGMKKQLGNIGHSAHLGGAIGGFITTLLVFPSIIHLQPRVVVLVAIPIVLLGIFGRRLNPS